MSTDSRVPTVSLNDGPQPGEFCYLFNPNGWYKGNPPFEAVVSVFAKSGPDAYTSFPIYHKNVDYWDFLDWDEPIVVAIIDKYLREKIVIDPDEYENEVTPEMEQRREEDDALYEYYSAMEEAGYYQCDSDDYEDPITAFLSLVSNPFHANDFREKMDTAVLSHLTELDKELSDENIFQCATDVSVGNLQLLNNAAADQIRVHSEDNIPLITKIKSEIWPNQDTRFKLHFVDYLTHHSDVAKDIAHTRFKSISNVLLHISDNVLVHTDDQNFEQFCAYYHGSTLSLQTRFRNYLESRGIFGELDPVEIFMNLSKNNKNTISFKDYMSYIESLDSTIITSPSYHPESPDSVSSDEDFDMIVDLDRPEDLGTRLFSELKIRCEAVSSKTDTIDSLTEGEFKMCVIAYTNYVLHVNDKFRPCNEFSLINFGYANSLDFCKKFRKKFRFFYISHNYQGRLVADLVDFLNAYLETDEGTRFVLKSLGST